MRVTSLKDIRCPMCKGILSWDETELPIISSETEYGQEIKEAFLHCSQCPAAYPVIAGVAILVQNPLTYLANNYSTIFSFASEYLSPGMIDYLRRNALDLVGAENYSIVAGTPRAMGAYIFAHYENISSMLPAEHPINRLVGTNHVNRCEQLLQFAGTHLPLQGQVLEIGCSVGGLSYRLAHLSQFVYGLDYSFCAALTARRILLAQPESQASYRLHIEGTQYQERILSIEGPNKVEFIVASADNLPFDIEKFDIVTCSNVLDIVPDPERLLDNVYSALRNGGIFIENDPYAWETSRAPIEQWFGGRPGEPSAYTFRAAIHKRFSLLAEQDLVPSILRVYERYFMVYFNHQLVARKGTAKQHE